MVGTRWSLLELHYWKDPVTRIQEHRLSLHATEDHDTHCIPTRIACVNQRYEAHATGEEEAHLQCSFVSPRACPMSEENPTTITWSTNVEIHVRRSSYQWQDTKTDDNSCSTHSNTDHCASSEEERPPPPKPRTTFIAPQANARLNLFTRIKQWLKSLNNKDKELEISNTYHKACNRATEPHDRGESMRESQRLHR